MDMDLIKLLHAEGGDYKKEMAIQAREARLEPLAMLISLVCFITAVLIIASSC